MKNLFLLGLLFPVSLIFSDENKLYQVKISDLLPTQSCVGIREVGIWKERINKEKKTDDWEKFLKKKSGTVVKRSEGLYLIDGHHFTRALQESDMGKLWVETEEDMSKLSTVEFWAKMKSKSWVYLFDCEGKSIETSALPKQISELKDDPYRSLSWMVREAGGYDNLKLPFQEFIWANFFRGRIKFESFSEDGWKNATIAAKKLALSDEASRLPGWLGKK